MTRRDLLGYLPAILALPLAQNYMQQPTPAPPANNQELTERVTVLELKDSGILAVMSMMNQDMRKIEAKMGHPGPHYPEMPGAT